MKRIGTLVLTVMLAVGGAAVVAAPAGADATHTVVVTPSTGLQDGQVVTVTGSGYTEVVTTDGWAAAMCNGKVLSQPFEAVAPLQDCDLATVLPVIKPDASGAISTSFTVRRTIAPQSGSVDCQTAPDGCAVLLGQFTPEGKFLGAVARVSFGPPPPTTVRDCAVRAWNDAAAGRPLRSVLRGFVACVLRVVARRHH
jgi:hypothetical protein